MKFLFLLFFTLVQNLSFANGIDDHCKNLTYKSAPIVNADLYVCNKQYALAYSYKHKNPIYTTEFLIASHIGNIQRTDDFRVDPSIPKQYQSTPQDYNSSICNGGRCDKGHMTPAKDFSACQECMSQSFFMSNMVPQNYKNNEVIWQQLERLIRNYAITRSRGVYIITGPIYTSNTPKTIGRNKVSVPDQLFKIVIDPETKKSFSILMPNSQQTLPLSSFSVNIETIEKATNIQFDNSLDKKTINIL